MSILLCHQCAVREQLITPLSRSDTNLTGSTYQMDKYWKHTAPTNVNGFVSVYDDPSYDAYRNYAINASYSGCVEKDDAGRVNIVWYAGKNIGVTFEDGLPVFDADTVKLVLSNDNATVHSFPVSSGSTLIASRCSRCGGALVCGQGGL